MPLYEEKLISPLAIRFTQEHIRTTFRDRRSVEATVDEITAGPGNGNYDVILSFPFPAIEVMRSRAAERENSSVSDLSKEIGERPDGTHWFTLDNRRLYCLQRAAIQLWPLRVAARVDALYADDGSARKKYDTTTYGCSVTISSSVKDPNCVRWDWRVKVFPQYLVSANVTDEAQSALDHILDDDEKDVDELLEATSISTLSMLLHAAPPASAGEQTVEVEPATCGKSQARSRTPSTAASSDESEAGSRVQDISRNAPKASQRQPWCNSRGPSGRKAQAPVTRAAQDTWWEEYDTGSWGDAWGTSWYDDLADSAVQEIERQLRIPERAGFVWIDNWNSQYLKHLGTLRQFLESRPDKFTVVPSKGRGYRVTFARCKQLRRNFSRANMA